MQVKVFESIDMASGLKMVKKELGPEALIISTRTVRNGKLGLLGKPTLEITAAIDNAPSISQSCDDTISETFRLEKRKQIPSFSCVVDQSLDHFLQTPPADSKNNPDDFFLTPSPNTESASSFLADEVNDLKNLVKNLTGEISRLHIYDGNHDSSMPSSLSKKESSPSDSDTASIRKKEIRANLRSKGINDRASRQITAFLYENLSPQQLEKPELVASTIIDTIQKLLRPAPPSLDLSCGQKRIAFTGPTGVGKTTTLAKIAASYLAGHSHSVALITIDTYRIAAVEQLKVYGEIMRLPVDVVITPEQLKRAIEKHQDKELILIDTAGRSPRDGLCIAELATFLSPELNIDKHLVLSATTREDELLNTIERFAPLGITNTIFTKVDECSTLGVLLNIQTRSVTPLSYVTNGQRVPEDLVEVSQNRVAELIMSQNEGLLHE